MGRDDEGCETAGPPSLGPYLALCAAVALWVDLGPIHGRHQGDSLMNVLVSLQAWTLFLWEQDRFGMLIPWLARPIRDPFLNLLFQEWLSITASLSVFFLLARYLVRDAAYPAVAGLGTAAFLALAPPAFAFEWYIDTGFAPGMALGLGALILAGPGRDGSPPGRTRAAAALGLMGLAHWVNLGTAVFLGPLVILRALLLGAPWRPIERTRDALAAIKTFVREALRQEPLRVNLRPLWASEPVRSSGLIVLGYEAGVVVMRQSPYPQTSMARLPPDRWPHAWSELLRNTWEVLAPYSWPVALALAAGLGLALTLARPEARRHLGRSIRVAAALVGAALAVSLFTGIWVWVELNEYSFRYYIPPVILLQAALAALAVAAPGRVLGASGRRRIAIAVGPLLLLAAAWGHGFPSASRVRADLDRTCGALTEDVLAAGCTHIAGEYWTIWPAVFHANLALHDRGDDRAVWGLSFRCQPTVKLWKGMPRDRIRVAVPTGDTLGLIWSNTYLQTPLDEVERRPTITVLRPRPKTPRQP